MIAAVGRWICGRFAGVPIERAGALGRGVTRGAGFTRRASDGLVRGNAACGRGVVRGSAGVVLADCGKRLPAEVGGRTPVGARCVTGGRGATGLRAACGVRFGIAGCGWVRPIPAGRGAAGVNRPTGERVDIPAAAPGRLAGPRTTRSDARSVRAAPGPAPRREASCPSVCARRAAAWRVASAVRATWCRAGSDTGWKWCRPDRATLFNDFTTCKLVTLTLLIVVFLVMLLITVFCCTKFTGGLRKSPLKRPANRLKIPPPPQNGSDRNPQR